MNLEDHAGDVIRKARAMSDVTIQAAAQAAGLSATELAEIENSGKFPKHIRLGALASLLGLDAAKLEGLANGWMPARFAPSSRPGFRMLTSAGDDLTVNCFLVWDVNTREAALFDTGFDAEAISVVVTAEHLELKSIFITHSHPDHVAALGELRARFPDAALRTQSVNAPAQHRNRPGETIPLGGLRITHRETPGHAADGVTYVIEGWPAAAPKVAIVGDAIFAGSMGRGNDSWELARQKVREQILSLPGDTLLCPGHGPLTTVEEELAHNPFF